MGIFKDRSLRCKLISCRFLLIVGLACLTLDPAFAHLRGSELGGFQSGFTHPIVGIDHLQAMPAVGIWGAQTGGRNVWTLPITFPFIMAAGSVLGMSGVVLPHVELAIALSVFILGLAIAFAWKPPEWLALLLIAIFAIFHGYAHGAELPQAIDPASYANGFVVATGLIHIAGIGIGFMLGRLWKGQFSQALGVVIAMMGLYFALGSFSL